MIKINFFNSYQTVSIIIATPFLFANTCLAEINLNFGVYTADKPTAIVKQFRPIMNVLETNLSQLLEEPVSIKMQVANTYEKGIKDLTEGKVDFSRFGPASYISAKKLDPNISILAIESKDGRKSFNGVICVREDSAIHKLSDLKGKRFAFGNELSTIGRYLSQQALLQHGVKAKDMAFYDYLGRHDAVGFAVAASRFDAGALKESTYYKLVKSGRPLRALYTFPNVTKPWLGRSELPLKIEKAIRESLLIMKDSQALTALKKDGFLLGEDSDYDLIRVAIQNNSAFFE